MALLAETNPELINEWHWEKNKDIDIRTVSRGSHKKAWWKCSMGHEWEAVIGNRARLGVGCAVCNGKKAQKGFNDLGTLLPESLEWWDYDKNFPLTPYDVTSQSNKKAWWRCSCGHSWQAVIATFKRGDRCPYCSGHKVLTGFNDLATTHPHLLEEWDYKKNTMRPAELSAGSITQVWWLCPQGDTHILQLYVIKHEQTVGILIAHNVQSKYLRGRKNCMIFSALFSPKKILSVMTEWSLNHMS